MEAVNAMKASGSFERILVPVDFSDCSASALQHAMMLQQASGAHIHVLHTYDLPAFIPPHSMLVVGDFDASLVEHAERFTRQRLEEFSAKLSVKPSDTVHFSLEVGPAAPTIVSVAEREQSDLIVMGTHGRTGWSRALLGSTTDKVLHSAPCAVLTVKSSGSNA